MNVSDSSFLDLSNYRNEFETFIKKTNIQKQFQGDVTHPAIAVFKQNKSAIGVQLSDHEFQFFSPSDYEIIKAKFLPTIKTLTPATGPAAVATEQNKKEQSIFSLFSVGKTNELIAALKKDKELLKETDVNQKTILHHAIQKPDPALIAELINLGAPLDAKDNLQQTPIQQLAQLSPSALVEILQKFVNPNTGIYNLINICAPLLQGALQKLPTNIKTKMEFLNALYDQLMGERFDILIDITRAMPGAVDLARRVAFLTKREKQQIDKLLTSFNLEILYSQAGTNKYVEWLKRRGQLSETISQMGNERSSDAESLQADKNWREAEIQVIQMAKLRMRLTLKEICELHRILGKDLPNNGGTPGVLRTTTSTWDNKNYVPPALVPKKMEEFLTWFQLKYEQGLKETGFDPIPLAAQTHHKLVNIHPYSDANGRWSRLILDFTLQSFNYPPALIERGGMPDTVFGELEDSHVKNVHPNQIILSVYKGVKNALEFWGKEK